MTTYRRTAIITVLLLFSLVFLAPHGGHAAAEGDTHVADMPYGPPVPANRVTALSDAPTAAPLRDAYVAPVPATAAPAITAKAYAVVDRACGAMLAGDNAHERLAPASTTKIVTALVALKHAAPDAMVDVDVDYEAPEWQDSTLMGLKPGMRLSMQDLLYGLMLPSGNDAAEAIARYVGGGNVGAFVGMMNDEAAAMGLNDSRFANPSGLDAPGLYSSAWDLAMAGRMALDNPLLMHISTTMNYKPAWDGPVLKNGNGLLKSYPGAIGLKTGFTDNARQTMVAAAERNGRQLVVSVLGSGDRYADARTLLDWAFDNTKSAC